MSEPNKEEEEIVENDIPENQEIGEVSPISNDFMMLSLKFPFLAMLDKAIAIGGSCNDVNSFGKKKEY